LHEKTESEEEEGRTVFSLIAVVLPLKFKEIPFFRVIKQGKFGQIMLHVLLVLGRLLFGFCLA